MNVHRLNPYSLYHSMRRRWIRRHTTFREQERLGLLKRPAYAYGLLKAADIARYFGHKQTTVCEFGVASGGGLLAMIALADRVSAETGIRFRIVGFDTGTGLPAPVGCKDHPEIWSAGDYPMLPDAKLAETIRGRAELLLGDIRDTVHPFLASLDPGAPLGFISVDVDIYTSAKHSLMGLLGRPQQYNPAVSIYFDDVGHFFANRWCGELAAIDEFNAANDLRKIDRDRSRRHRQHGWFEGMYVCHILDHPSRATADPDRPVKAKASGNLPPGVLN